MTKSANKLNELLKLLQNTLDDEIDCDVFNEKMPYLAEVDWSAHAAELMLYKHHLELCPGCSEALELLKDVVVADESNS